MLSRLRLSSPGLALKIPSVQFRNVILITLSLVTLLLVAGTYRWASERSVPPSVKDAAQITRDRELEQANLKANDVPYPGTVAKALVMAKTREENVNWAYELKPDWIPYVYSTDHEPGFPLALEHNVGREAMAYLTFIIDNYAGLPEYTAFVHSGFEQWHNDVGGVYTPDTIKELRIDTLKNRGYLNLRCHSSPGCPISVLPWNPTETDIKNNDTRARLKQIYVDLFDVEEDKIPREIGSACCAQFALTKERIRQRPQSDYIRMRDWALNVDLDTFGIGWVFEMMWHIVFGQEAVDLGDYAQNHPDAKWSLLISQHEEAYGNNKRPTQVKLMLNQQETNLKYDICRLPSTFTGQALSDLASKYGEEHPQVDNRHLGYFPRLVEREPLSDATIALVRDWLRACTNHAFCRAQKDRPLPKRLIDVRPSRKVMLIEPNGETGHYLALSHCWGSVDDTFSTTKDNIAERSSEGIEISELPNNFKDAIAFTRRLGYYYLWIDSLCILQHDQDDWACEASKMAWYYSNAILTLVVADALSCHVGFLGVRNHSTSPLVPGEGEEYYCLRQVLPDDYDL
ncbi:hypothetical protein MMC27_003256 [Xylographa pallens]|nr:hypothetical protein [Xylographa pallens]